MLTPAHCKRKSSFAIHDVVSNSAIIRLSPLPSSFPSTTPFSCGSIHILITAFPSPALRHSIRARPASGFALLLPPLCEGSLLSEAHQNKVATAKEWAKGGKNSNEKFTLFCHFLDVERRAHDVSSRWKS